MSISDDDVRNAYRFILGRAPENENVVRGHRNSHQSIADLRIAFLRSDEFRNQEFVSEGPFLALEPPPDVDVKASPSELRSMVARTIGCWAKAGASEPYWSVLGEKFLSGRWNENRDDFYKSGVDDTKFLVALLRRVGRSPEDVKRVVDFGCGVGRITIPLARTFANVVAIDISQMHLDLAKQYANAAELSNIGFLLATPDNIMPATGYDLWFSRLVLMHNPPPVIGAILRQAFEGLVSNGAAIVYLPTYKVGYSFHLDDYMKDTHPPEIEFHPMPVSSVLKIASEQNCWLMDIHEERGHKDGIFHLFTFVKK
jgi:SAM-dependent methyltransferase